MVTSSAAGCWRSTDGALAVSVRSAESFASGSRAGEGEVDAAIVDSPGSTPRLGSVRLGPRVPGTTLIEVTAAPLNPLDLLIASGGFHSLRHEASYVPGSECAGIVLESDNVEVGTRVYGECHASPQTPGALAKRTLIRDESLLQLPDDVDPMRASAVGNAGTAAYMAMVDVARLRQGDAVLVLGATGAVGQLAIQIARLLKASSVVGAGRRQEVLDRLPQLGATGVIALRDGEQVDELGSRLSAVGPFDVVLDGTYGTPLEAALQACAPRARIVNVGNLAGASAQVPAGLLRGKQLTLSGFAGLHTPLRDKQTALAFLWGALARQELSVEVRTYALERIATAWGDQAASPHGKCVISPNSPKPAAPPTEHTSR